MSLEFSVPLVQCVCDTQFACTLCVCDCEYVHACGYVFIVCVMCVLGLSGFMCTASLCWILAKTYACSLGDFSRITVSMVSACISVALGLYLRDSGTVF